MDSSFISVLILAIIQGITEWFPISSSGHLVLFSEFLNYEINLIFETAVHFGTLMAVFVYFGKEITDILRDFLSLRWGTKNGKMGWLLIVATIPAVFVGFFARNFFDAFSSLSVLATGFGITGLLLLIVSSGKIFNGGKNMSVKNSFFVGIAQALSIIPGISRSGATISSGIFLGLNEKDAMKFSFLMAIPIIIGANILSIGNQTLPLELFWATLVSFLVGLLGIHIVFKYVLNKKNNFKWFGIYCLLLSFVLVLYLFMK